MNWPGQTADKNPVSIKPWKGDRGEESYPDTDDVGQVEVGVIIVGLCQGVGHHSGIINSSLLIWFIMFYQYQWCRQVSGDQSYLYLLLWCDISIPDIDLQ